MAKLSVATDTILRMVTEKYAGLEFNAEQAKEIWNGTEPATFADLTQTQKLQLALLDAINDMNQLLDQIKKTAVPNREARRKFDKQTKKLHLPK